MEQDRATEETTIDSSEERTFFVRADVTAAAFKIREDLRRGGRLAIVAPLANLLGFLTLPEGEAADGSREGVSAMALCPEDLSSRLKSRDST